MKTETIVIVTLTAIAVSAVVILGEFQWVSSVPLIAFALIVATTYVVSDLKSRRLSEDDTPRGAFSGVFMGIGVTALPLVLSDISRGAVSSATTSVVALGMLCLSESFRRHRSSTPTDSSTSLTST